MFRNMESPPPTYFAATGDSILEASDNRTVLSLIADTDRPPAYACSAESQPYPQPFEAGFPPPFYHQSGRGEGFGYQTLLMEPYTTLQPQQSSSSSLYPLQQTTLVVVSTNQPMIHQQEHPICRSFSSHVICACLSFWFCGGIFGLIAFILAGRFL